jgi:ankyrin repeat protein
MKFLKIGLFGLLFIPTNYLFSMELEDTHRNEVEMKEMDASNHLHPLSYDIFYSILEHYLSGVQDDEPKLYQACQKLLITSKRFTAPVLYFLEKKFESKKLSKLHIAVQLNALHWIRDYIAWLKNNLEDTTEIKKIVSCVDADGHTPLLYAVLNCNKEIANLLIDNGAKFYRITKSNNWWSNSGKWGVNRQSPDSAYYDFLDDLCGSGRAQIAEYFDPNLDLVAKLGEQVVNNLMKLTSAKNLYFKTKLFQLIHQDLNPVSNALLIKNYLKNKLVNVNDIHFSKFVKCSPLMAAALELKHRAMKILIDNGAAVNLQDDNGDTALFCAFVGYNGSARSKADWDNYFETVGLLLERGAAIDVKNKQNLTIIDLLFGYGCNQLGLYAVSFLHVKLLRAIKNNDLEEVKYRVGQGADVKFQNANGDTVLHLAMLMGNQEIIVYLIAQGADVNIKNAQGLAPFEL